jgi:acetyl-CoA carboxylase biotin carboxyl carrier protein
MNDRDIKKIDRLVEESESSIKRLIKLVEESGVESLELTAGDRKIKITQRATPSNGQYAENVVLQPLATPSPQPQPAQPVSSTPQQPASAPTTQPTEDTGKLVPIKSPMVGTFYAAPAPDADPYVTQNQKISVGQIVCIVEAMKLMNEIESEVSGRIAQILVKNAEPVEFGQTLFMIEPD